MKLEAAIKQIKKESDFLGLSIPDTLKFIRKSPLCVSIKTVEAMKVLETCKLS